MPKINRHGQAKILSDTDYVKLLREIINPKHRLLIQVARYTGERWGAICQLKVSDVYSDPTRRIPETHITFRASTRKASPDGKRETRQVPICDQLKQELKAYDLPIGNGWLFFNRYNPSQPMSFRNADRFFHLALDRAGLGDGYSTHSTRRTFITCLARSGVGLTVIQKITGHNDLKSLQRYVEVSDEQVTNALAVL